MNTDRSEDESTQRPGNQISVPTWPFLVLIVFYCISRYVFYVMGIRFDDSPLEYFWQIVDPALLRNDLWRSVSHLHSQPPLFNLILGVVLKVFPEHATSALSLLYKLFGIGFSLAMASLMIRFGLPPLAAIVVAALYSVSPSVIIYENFLLYEYPAAAILCVTAWAFQRFADTRGISKGAMFFFGCGILVFLRSGFTLLWFGSVFAIAVCLLWPARRKVVYASCVPLMAVLLLYAHNYHQFGLIGTSSWLGMSLNWMTVRSIPDTEREVLAERGEISELSLIKPYQGISAYAKHLRHSGKTNVPLLDQEFKSNNEVNLHHIGYVQLSERYLQDAIRTMTIYPVHYLYRVGVALSIFFTPSSKYGEFVDRNRKEILAWESLYDRLLCCVEVPVFPGMWQPRLCIISIECYLAVLLGTPLLAWVRRKKSPAEYVMPKAVFFVWFNVLYVTLLFNCVDFGENMRFRFLVEHFVWILTAWMVTELVRFFKRRTV